MLPRHWRKFECACPIVVCGPHMAIECINKHSITQSSFDLMMPRTDTCFDCSSENQYWSLDIDHWLWSRDKIQETLNERHSVTFQRNSNQENSYSNRVNSYSLWAFIYSLFCRGFQKGSLTEFVNLSFSLMTYTKDEKNADWHFILINDTHCITCYFTLYFANSDFSVLRQFKMMTALHCAIATNETVKLMVTWCNFHHFNHPLF